MSDLEEWTTFGSKWGFKNEIKYFSGYTLLEWHAHEGTMKGYTGFSLSVEFDSDGTFIKAGVWE